MSTIGEDTRKICVDCGGTWTIGPGESQFYRDRNLEQPRRCTGCRAARRAEKQARADGTYGRRD